MEPFNTSTPESYVPPAGTEQGLQTDTSITSTQTSEVTLSEPKIVAQGGDENTNEQIIEQLKEQRDTLRGLNESGVGKRSKLPKIRTVLFMLLAIAGITATYILLIKPALDKPVAELTSSSQKTFSLPSNLESKTSEEKTALAIISLARGGQSDAIANTYLNKAHLGEAITNFKALVTSYGSSADGAGVELVEKTVGKVDFASTGESSAIAETTSEFEAASLVYKSSYFNHTNNLYLKINLYKPDPSVDAWKMYVFEFKAGDSTSPLKADVHIPV